MMSLNPSCTLQELREEARRNSLHLVEIDLTDCSDKTAVMQRFSESLVLPASFGFNWDALVDVLRDLKIADNEHGLVVAVYGVNALQKKSPRDYAVLKDILEEWSAESDPGTVKVFIFNTLLD